MSENETNGLGGNEMMLKTLNEKENEVNEIFEKEVMSGDVVQVELDVRKSVEGEDCVSEKIGSQKEKEIGVEGEDRNDVEQVKEKNGKVVKRVSVKSLGKSCQVRYQLPREKEGKFNVKDLVWGKVRSHPWWPGQIFDQSDASAEAMKHFKRNCHLVAYYGDGTFAWNEASKLKSFRTHFSRIEKQKNSEAFRSAVESALGEVKRRVEFGLTCSCVPKDTYDKIKLQTVKNCGIREEPSFINRIDESLNGNSFSPETLLEYLKDLSKFPTGGFDRLELIIAKAQLLSFNRLKGYSYLPELQYYKGLENDADTLVNDVDKRMSEVNEHTVQLSKIGDLTGTGDSKAANLSRRKRKNNQKDGVYPAKKKSLLDSSSLTPNSTNGDNQNDEAIANLVFPALSKKQKTINHYAGVSRKKGGRKTISLEKNSNTTKQSFMIGECIRRVASKLTGPPSMLNYSGDKSQMLDGNADSFSGNESDSFSPTLEETQKSSLTFPTEFSSLDDLLSLLQRVAEEPRGDYSFLTVIVSFFSDFRNSIIMANDFEKDILPTNIQLIDGSAKTYDFDDRNDTYCTDMIIQNGSEEQSHISSRLDYQHSTSAPEKHVHVYTRRSNSKKQHFDSNHAEVSEKPAAYTDEISPAELVLSFTELDSVPSETSLNNIFKHFGPLKESETEIDRGSSRARVVFKKCVDAEVAFSSAKKFNIFGQSLVNYQLNYSPTKLFKASSFATTQDQELHLDLSNVELNMA